MLPAHPNVHPCTRFETLESASRWSFQTCLVSSTEFGHLDGFPEKVAHRFDRLSGSKLRRRSTAFRVLRSSCPASCERVKHTDDPGQAFRSHTGEVLR